MGIIKKVKNLKFFWKVFIIWAVLILISTIIGLSFIKKYDENTEYIQEHLYDIYKQTMTSNNAYRESMLDSLHYPANKEEIKKKYGVEEIWLPPSLSIKDMKSFDKLSILFSSIMLLLILTGIIFWFSYFFFIIYKLIRKKLTNKKERFLRFTGLTIVLGLVIFIIYSNNRYNRFSEGYKKQNELNNIYGTSFYGLIELSNDIYRLYEIDSESSYHQGNFLVQLEYLKKKTEDRLLKNKKIANKEKAKPVIEICEGIIKFIDLYTSGKNRIEQGRDQAKAIAEFRVVLDKLQDFTRQTKEDWGAFSKYTLLMFSKDAISKYKDIKEGENYSIYLLFGYYLYDAVEENIEKDYK